MSGTTHIVQVIGTHQEIANSQLAVSRLAYEQTSLHDWKLSQYGRDHHMISVTFSDLTHAKNLENGVEGAFPGLKCATIRNISAPALKIA